MSVKGASTVIDYHDNSIKTALLELFPDIGLEKGRFFIFNLPYRRKYMQRYAKDNHFDPLIAEHWYSQSRERLLTLKACLFATFF